MATSGFSSPACGEPIRAEPPPPYAEKWEGCRCSAASNIVRMLQTLTQTGPEP